MSTWREIAGLRAQLIVFVIIKEKKKKKDKKEVKNIEVQPFGLSLSLRNASLVPVISDIFQIKTREMAEKRLNTFSTSLILFCCQYDRATCFF